MTLNIAAIGIYLVVGAAYLTLSISKNAEICEIIKYIEDETYAPARIVIGTALIFWPLILFYNMARGNL